MSWHPPYAEHPAIGYSASVIRNMPERTGRSMDEWVSLALREGPEGEATCREWLRKTYSLGGTTANGIAKFAYGDGGLWADPVAYLEAAPKMVDLMYAGKKAHLRPIHDAVVRLALDLHPDLRLCPTKTTVPFYRNHVIANLRPTTQKRVDLGLCIRLGKPPGDDRVISMVGKAGGDRINHRIPLQHVDEVDDLVASCFEMAYSEDG